MEAPVSTILGAIEDDACRTIIEATSENALSVSEICEQTEITSSTAYRKVEQLTDAGILEENIRLCSGGSHTSEYRLAISDLEIELGSEGIDLSLTPRETPQTMVTSD